MLIDRAVAIQRIHAATMDRLRSGGRWYQIANAEDGSDTTHIRIYEQIGGWFGKSARAFVQELDEIDTDNIVVSINSPGGDVFDGIAIYNALRMHDAHVTTQVDGLAASIASVIVQAGDERQMVTHSQMMIHEPWGIWLGDTGEMREFADLLDKQGGVIAGIYADLGGKTIDEYRELMAATTWMTHTETVDNGLADRIIDPSSVDRPNAEPDDPDDGDDLDGLFDDKQRFSQHVDSVVTGIDRLVERFEDVVTFRTEQGKTIDEDWRSKSGVDDLAAAAERLRSRLSAEPPTTPDAAAAVLDDEWLRYIATTQGV